MIRIFVLTLFFSCVIHCMEDEWSCKNMRCIRLPGSPTHIASSLSGDVIACDTGTHYMTCIKNIPRKGNPQYACFIYNDELEAFNFCHEHLFVIVKPSNDERRCFSMNVCDAFFNESGEKGKVSFVRQDMDIKEPKAHILYYAHDDRLLLLSNAVRKATWSPIQKGRFLVVRQDDTLAEWHCDTPKSNEVISYCVKDADYNADGTRIFALTQSNEVVIFGALFKNHLKRIPLGPLQSMNTLHGVGNRTAFLTGTTNTYAIVDTKQEDESEAVKKETINTWSSIITSHFNRDANLMVIAGMYQDGKSGILIIS